MIEAAKLEADIYPAGPRGLSAYEIYKKEGGQLSEEEWLKSLNGLTPTIGENGNWFLGTVDTGLPSRGPKGDTGSIKFIVATELPTENIDETAIYLKPVESPTGENNFEELIYVNGKWEDLGTPNVAVDLSNYYTKEESNEKLLAKQDKLVAGDGIKLDGNVIKTVSEFPIYKIQTTSNSISSTDYTDIDRQSKLKIAEKINEAYKNGLNSIGFIVSSKTNNEHYLFVNCDTSIQYKRNDYWFYSIGSMQKRYFNNDTDLYSLLTLQLSISLSWTNDTCECTNAIIWKNKLPLLGTDNKIIYTPTSDYNPATKKYVDDNVKTYTAGNNIEISDDNVISSSVNSFIELTDETVILKNLNVGIYKLTSSVKYIEYTTNKTYNTAGYMDCFMFVSNYRGIKTGYLFYNNTITFFDGSTSSVAYGYVEKSIPNILTTYQDATIRGTHTYTTLPKTTLVPTTDDQFVNKKYVDDQVGNINTILATLTTVSEVSE